MSTTPQQPPSPLPPTAPDRAIGTILGSALGDTIGLYTEFLTQDAARKAYPSAKFSLVEPVTPLLGDSHRDRFPPRTWTDDTDHALLFLLTYLSTPTPTPLSAPLFAARLRRWTREGIRALSRPPLGTGNTIAGVVSSANYLSDPAQVSREYWIRHGRRMAANGSLMRTHVIGVLGAPGGEEEVWRVAAEVGVVTHADPRCVVACCVVGGLVRGLVRGTVVREGDVDCLLERSWAWVRARGEYADPRAGEGEGDVLTDEQAARLLDKAEFDRHVYADTYAQLALDERRSMGYVYKCLGAAILALRLAMRGCAGGYNNDYDDNNNNKNDNDNTNAHLFERIITDLVMQAGDADTNAAVAGALVGAWVGRAGLPAHWADGLVHGEWLVGKAEEAVRVAGIGGDAEGQGEYVPSPDTAPDFGMGEMTEREVLAMERGVWERMLVRKREREEEERRRKGWGIMGFVRGWMG
ncbi:ADP-ribosylglycohydrolase [Pseudovirgaria hyperparasitica]|uniref:ADP-ribosylglycohydrolase n=1 Tax=Pseudovirgaria hyperparasitica TaxID=470096 RepID=A0A6A6WB50_9PEZI|nr:ADP-ribosylglycohydrolase [Pseudovirgaria hyperparasitica]KAF2759190.1 ADP-ribosylglycohydrolase [Pseudovirgaria hyperparasitica]